MDEIVLIRDYISISVVKHNKYYNSPNIQIKLIGSKFYFLYSRRVVCKGAKLTIKRTIFRWINRTTMLSKYAHKLIDKNISINVSDLSSFLRIGKINKILYLFSTKIVS